MTPSNPVALAKFRLSPRGNGRRIPYDYTGERGHLIGRYYAQQITGTQRFIISWHDAHDIAQSIELDYLDAIEWLDATQGNEPPQAPAQPEPEAPKVDKRLKENRQANEDSPTGYMSVNEIAEMYHFTSAKVRRDLQLLSDDIQQQYTKRGLGGKWYVKSDYVQAMYNTPEDRHGCAWFGRINLDTWEPTHDVEWLAVKEAEQRYNVTYNALRHYCYRNRPLLRARGLIKKVDGVLYIAEELVSVMWGKKSEKIKSR